MATQSQVYSEKFLDFVIKNTGNSDGFVLLHDSPYDHCGNFSKLEDAQRYAILNFMVKRPSVFSQCIINRTQRTNSGTMHEFFKLRDQLNKEGIEMPNSITPSPINLLILFNGEFLDGSTPE